MRVSRTDTNDAVRVVALKRSRHPVRDRLNDCAANWDGVARDDTWLIRLGGAPDTPLVRAQSAKFLISAVARIMEPGCQVDHVLVLRGPTGGKKTSALRALAMRNEWFHDEVDPVTKDGKIALAGGVWIALDDEFAGLRGGNERKKKSYVTRRIEKFRSPYDVWDKRHARQCVLTAAVNEDEILSDPTGGRRYWIVDVQGFDIAALVAEVEQLWAEAVHRYRAGEKWHLVEPKLVAAAAMVQEGARTRDAWEEPVAKRLAKKSAGEGVTTHDILRGIENDERIEHSADELRDAELRIANLLRTLGWQKCDASRNRRGHLRDGVRVRLFFKGGKCPKCGRRERGEESEKRENDGHHGHSLEIKDKKVRPPPDNTPDTPGQSASGATSENGAAKAAYAAPLDSLGTAQVATAPLLARERGRRRITARERANANGEGARSR
jgi:predicted P-loop ATPase